MTGVRWRRDVGPDGGFEGQCEACLEWWPLDLEFWYPRRSLRHCRDCERTKTRLRLAKLREDPAVRAQYVADNRAYYEYARDAINAKRREQRRIRRLLDPEYAERRRAYQREWKRRRREQERAAA
jgi:hypothetical protein